MSEAPTEMITVNGLRTGHYIYGTQPGTGHGSPDSDAIPVLALHGWGGSIQSFWPVAQQLAKQGRYTIHLLDFPGFGATDPPPEAWGVADYAAWVIAYLDAHDLTANVHVLGHSFGGRVSLILGAEHAQRFAKFALANAAGVRPPENSTVTGVAKFGKQIMSLPGLKALYEPVRRQFYKSIGETDYLEAGPLQETFVRVIAEDLLPYAARVTVPTLLIWGDLDKDTPLWQGKKLEETIPDAGLVVFNGAGHFSYLERLLDYVRIVDHFFSTSTAADADEA